MTLLTKELSRPNGLAFSPDEKTLYVANSDPAKAIWMAYPVKADGTLGAGKVFKDVTSMVGKQNPGLPDGLNVDAKGNLFATGPGGVHVYAPDGTLLGRIETGQATANCAFGGDGSDLYITADMYIVRVKTKTKGAGTLKIATWNVNGIRARQAQLEAWLARGAARRALPPGDQGVAGAARAARRRRGLPLLLARRQGLLGRRAARLGARRARAARVLVPPFDFEQRIVTARAAGADAWPRSTCRTAARTSRPSSASWAISRRSRRATPARARRS